LLRTRRAVPARRARTPLTQQLGSGARRRIGGCAVAEPAQSATQQRPHHISPRGEPTRPWIGAGESTGVRPFDVRGGHVVNRIAGVRHLAAECVRELEWRIAYMRPERT